MKLQKALTLLIISLFFASFVLTIVPTIPTVAATGQNWLTGWTYRQLHVINSVYGAGTNYQVNMTVYYGNGTSSGSTAYLNNNSQTNFGDVRFTALDGSTLLNYWMQTYVSSNYAVFWVQLDSTTDLSLYTETIYLYYGNSTVSTLSSPQNTFNLFDDFSQDGGVLDTGLWSTFGTAPTITNNVLKIDGTVTTSGIVSNIAFSSGHIIQAYGNVTQLESGALRVGFNNDTTPSTGDYVSNSGASYVVSSGGSGNGWGTADTNNHLYSCGRSDYLSRVYGYVDTSSYYMADSISADMKANLASAGNYPEYIQWVLVRKYAINEPTHGLWGAEENAFYPTPSFPIDSYPIAGINTTQAVRWQSKAFTALGRFWVFYDDKVFASALGHETGMYFYTSSTDGKTWDTPTFLNFTFLEWYGENLVPLSNGSHVWIFGGKNWMAFGALHSNGTITFADTAHYWWDSTGVEHNINGPWQILPSYYLGSQVDSYATLDSNGYPWFIAGIAGSPFDNMTTYIWKDIYNNGSWAIGNTGNAYNATAIISGDSTGTANTNNGIIPLANGKMYIFSYYGGHPVYGYLWDGYSLTKETCSTASIFVDYMPGGVNEGYGRAITVDLSGNIYFAFPTTTSSLVLEVRNQTTGRWTETTVQNAVMDGCSPALGWINNALFLYWIAGSSTIASECIVNGVPDGNLLIHSVNGTIPLFYDVGYNGRLNAFSFQYGQQSAFLFVTYSTSGSYNYTLNLGFFTSPIFIYAGADEHSTISPSGYTSVTNGSSQTFTYSVMVDYAISNILVDGYSVSPTLYPTSYTFTNVTSLHTILISTIPTPPLIVNVSGEGVQYFFRSDTATTLGVTGYSFDKDYTNTAQTINETYSGYDTVSYAFQIYLFTGPTHYTELTSGPSAIIDIDGNYTGDSTSTFTVPLTNVALGYQALQITILERFGSGEWVTIANFVSPLLITNSIETSTWTFSLYLDNQQYAGNTHSSFFFGNSQYRSGISNVVFGVPKDSEIQMWRLGQMDLVGFVIGSYYPVLGSGFYALILLLIGGVLYFRYGSASIVVFFFVLFGGSGGLAFILLPIWAAAPVAGLLILAFSFTVWRIIR